MDIRDRLLHAAARVYSETGFRGATTRRIAQEAGVNEITIFRHFGSKATLIHEAIACAGRGVAPPTLPDPPRDPRAELLEWARTHIAELRQKRSLIRTCMGEIEEHPDLIPAERSPTSQAAHALATYLRRLSRQWLARGDFDPVAASTMLMGVLFADAMGRDIMPDMFCNDPDAAVEAYVELLLQAVGAACARRKHG